ncbi:hypothetical protein BH24ACT5_BH24ACT5_27290 [soil metagenome]
MLFVVTLPLPAGAEPPAGPDQPLAGPQGAVGQFVVNCDWSHTGTDDPIVHPGHSGVSHQHEFFGNVSTAADSGYDSMIEADTSCEQRLDTAAYWVPALYDREGDTVRPIGSTAYYRAGAGVDPATVQPYPPALMIVAGRADAMEEQPVTVVAWTCGSGGSREPRPPACVGPAGPRLLVTFPDCWNGADLDSEDHRSHVSYSHDWACDDEHPVPIPQLQFAVDYPVVDGDPSGLSLASGATHTAHADFWNTWDQAKLDQEVELCLVAQHVCGVS